MWIRVMKGVPLFLAGCLLLLVLGGCQPVPIEAAPTEHVPAPLPTGTAFAALDVTGAFAVPGQSSRREIVLSATGAFLREADPQLSDEVLSAEYTTLAFACNCLSQPMPALIDRQDALAMISLPDGLGLYLYDLDSGDDVPVLELSRWTVGLNALQVSWGGDEIVAGYSTQGSDGLSRVHALLAVKDESGWRTAWAGDEEPGWWFNAVGGQLNLAPDRSVLTVSGSAEETTQAFYEEPGVNLRVFDVNWQREGNSYVTAPPMPQYSGRTEWLWEVAEPSPYATLVEFVERLQAGDVEGAGGLVSDQEVLSAAADFGLALPERRYQVLSIDGAQIVFRDLQGTFVADFKPPGGDHDKWLITGIYPPGGNTSTGD
jgi:hypothetical protein